MDTQDSRPWHAHYPPGIPPRLEYDRLPLGGLLERTATRFPDRTAVVFMNARLTYRQLHDDVRRMATAMARLGVEPGQRVAIQTPNLPQAVVAYNAALSIGAQVVMTNPLYTAPEIEHQWKDAEIVLAVVMDYVFDQKIRAIRDRLPVRNYVLASIPEYLRFPLNLLAPFKLRRTRPPAIADVPSEAGVHAFRELVRGTEPAPPRVEVSWDDIALLQYTGGTTGVSKGAVLTHANLYSNVQQIDTWFHPEGADRGKANVMLAALPLFHVFGLTVCMNWGIHSGATIVLLPDPRDVKTLVRSVAKHRVTIFPGVPAMFNALNEYPGIESLDVSSVESCFSGSAPIAPDVLKRFETLTGARILEGFGLSETSPVTHCNPMLGERKIGSVGIPIPDTDARIVDVDDGTRELPTGEEGELVLRGPQVMQGYWNRPDETADCLRNGWLHTGDLAVVDEDGFFRIVGRKKDMINCNGLKVYPDEVDHVLAAHEDIVEAATIGVPDPRRIEIVKSFVVRRPGSRLTEKDVAAWCREQLAPYKVPREIEFLDELPKSSVLKVLRRELREQEIRRRAELAASEPAASK